MELTVENNISPSPLIVTEMTRDSTSEEHPHAAVNAEQASSTVMTKKVVENMNLHLINDCHKNDNS